MTAISGSLIGPGNDAADGTVSLLNPLDSLRADLYDAYGGRMGAIRGGAISGVGGLMQVSIAAGSWCVAERDGSGNPTTRAYRLDSTAATVVAFGAASASARNDALVAAAIDTEDGARGTGNQAIGWHLVVVPGVSGTVTARTNAQIAAWLGRGGWERLADVPIASTDTSINMTNLVRTAATVPFLDSGNITNAFTAAAGWTINVQWLRRIGRNFYFNLEVTRTGADITHSGTGNVANTDVATWSTTLYPILFDVQVHSGEIGYIAVGYAQSGTIKLGAVADPTAVSAGEGLQFAGHWVSA